MRKITEIAAHLWRGVEARAGVAALLYAGTLCAASLTAVAVWEKTPLGAALGPVLSELAAAVPLPGAPMVQVGPGAPVVLAPPVAPIIATAPVAVGGAEPAVVSTEAAMPGPLEPAAEGVPEEPPQEAGAPGVGVEDAVEMGASTPGEAGEPEPRVTQPTAPAPPSPPAPRAPTPVPPTAVRPDPAPRSEASGDAGVSPQSGVASV